MGFIASRPPTRTIDAAGQRSYSSGRMGMPSSAGRGFRSMLSGRFLAKSTLLLCLFIMVCLVAKIMRMK